MTIDQAIEILTLDKTCDFEGDADDLVDALRLGIEALKRWQHIRKHCGQKEAPLLPGETKE